MKENHISYPIEKVATIVGGRLEARGVQFSSISYLLTDSRKLMLPSESLFFAIKTKKNDGHKYINELYEKGVRNFIIEELSPEWKKASFKANFVIVKNTVLALQALASYHRLLFNIPVIGISGSNGKTVVKEWLGQLLSPDRRLVMSPKSYNSKIGVPLSVWQMKEADEMAVFEAGISEPFEMECLEAMIKPTIGIFTNIGDAHDENFYDKWQKVAEKLLLFKEVDVLIYCADYYEIDVLANQSMKGRTYTWGRGEMVDVRVLSEMFFSKSCGVQLEMGGLLFDVLIPFSDKASVENCLHCIALMLYLGYTIEEIVFRVASLSPIEMRLELKEGIHNCLIINDSYSSDLNSLLIALDFLQQQLPQKKTLILSDFSQVRPESTELYEALASLLEKKEVGRLIGVGEGLFQNANRFNMEKSFFKTTEELLQGMDHLLFQSEVILIKGARRFEFERVNRVLQKKSHQTVLEIDLSALAWNLNYYRAKLSSSVRLMAMVKAFSYGSGSVEVAAALQYQQVDYLTVAYSDEGEELRRNGIHVPIMVMNPEEESLEKIFRYQLEPDIYNFRVLQLFESAIQGEAFSREQPLSVHIELDTGMHRLGFLETDMEPLAEALIRNPLIEVKSVFSHLVASEDIQEDGFSLKQAARFERMTAYLQSRLRKPFLRHLLNSSGVSRFPNLQYDMVRVGIGLYGVASEQEEQQHLKQVGTLKSIISQIKWVKEGESVGYNRKWVAMERRKIAVVPIGYADGLDRKLGYGRGRFYVHGQMAPIIGSICMDMCMLDVTGIECKELDEVLIFGKEQTVKEVADLLETIPYEILTSISQRVKRVYFQE